MLNRFQGWRERGWTPVEAEVYAQAGVSGVRAASVGVAFYSVYASFAIFVIFPMLYFWPERKAAEAGST